MTKGKKKKEYILTAETAGYALAPIPASSKDELLRKLPKAEEPKKQEHLPPVHYSKIFSSNLLGRKPWEAPKMSKTFRENLRKANPENYEDIIKALQEGEAPPRLRLTDAQHKLVKALQQTLRDQSKEHWNPKREGYYTGAQQEITKWEVDGIKHDVRSPVVSFDLYSLAKTYTGKKHPSGRDMEILREVLESLSREEFTFWTAVKTREKVTKKTKRTEPVYACTASQSNLYWILQKDSTQEVTITEEGSPVSDTPLPTTYTVVLHPILTDFSRGHVPVIEEPIRQMKPGEYRHLFGLLVSEHIGEKEWSIREDRLFEQIFPGYYEQKRRKKMLELFQGAVDELKQAGQLLEAFPSETKTGEIKWVFRFPQKDT